jgi:hypothetical protein
MQEEAAALIAGLVFAGEYACPAWEHLVRPSRRAWVFSLGRAFHGACGLCGRYHLQEQRRRRP